MLPFRQVARVIVIDSTGFILLRRYSETRGCQGISFWVPPGGALEPGENHPTVALRELREGTSLEAHLERPLWERRFTLQMQCGPVDQVERYFPARLPLEKPPVLNSSEEACHRLFTVPRIRGYSPYQAPRLAPRTSQMNQGKAFAHAE